MSDRDALLRAIIDNPAEDTPRLVFADWLDEHADAFPTPWMARVRAAFIRDDVLFSQRDEFDPAHLRWELVEKPQRESEPCVAGDHPAMPKGCEFVHFPLCRRGFPWRVTLERPDWRHVPDISADTFPLDRVTFRGCGSAAVEALRVATWRRRVSAIEFDQSGSGSVGVPRLLAVDGLDRLEWLSFLRDAINPAEARELVASPLFRKLTSLTINGSPVGGAVAEAIAREGVATGLRELGLVNCRLPVAALVALLDSPAAPDFEVLSLGGDRVRAQEKFRALGRAPHLPVLRSLAMSEDGPNEAGLEVFLASPLVATLKRLDLSRCSLNRERTRMLASGGFGGLRVLRLNGNAVGNDGAAALARSPHLAGLQVLELSYSQVGDEGIEAILESPLADGLVLLDLTGSPASDETKELLKARMGDRVRV